MDLHVLRAKVDAECYTDQSRTRKSLEEVSRYGCVDLPTPARHAMRVKMVYARLQLGLILVSKGGRQSSPANGESVEIAKNDRVQRGYR